MTIAVGFVCNDGVLLGADTEITYSATSKATEGKILRVVPDGNLYLTYSGDTWFVGDLIQKVREECGNHVSPENAFSLLENLYRTHMQSQSLLPVEEQTWTELLVVTRKDKRHLYKYELEFEPEIYQMIGKNTCRVKNYAVTGIGAEVARAIFDSRYQSFDLMRDAVVLMVDGIRRVKAAVPGCGGSTNLIGITNEENWFIREIGQEEIFQIEKDTEFLDKQLRILYQQFPQSMNGDNLDKNLDVLKTQLLRHRESPSRLKISF